MINNSGSDFSFHVWKRFDNGDYVILNEIGETKADAAQVYEIFSDFFIPTAHGNVYNEDIASVPQVIDEYANHPSVMVIKAQYDKMIDITLTS